jgi:chromosome segregation ATPase
MQPPAVKKVKKEATASATSAGESLVVVLGPEDYDSRPTRRDTVAEQRQRLVASLAIAKERQTRQQQQSSGGVPTERSLAICREALRIAEVAQMDIMRSLSIVRAQLAENAAREADLLRQLIVVRAAAVDVRKEVAALEQRFTELATMVEAKKGEISALEEKEKQEKRVRQQAPKEFARLYAHLSPFSSGAAMIGCF